MSSQIARTWWAQVVALNLAWLGSAQGWLAGGAGRQAKLSDPAQATAAASAFGLRRTNFVWLDASACGGRPLRSVADWPACRAVVLQRMQSVMGPLPGPERRCPLQPKIEQETDAGWFVRRLVSYQVEPG